MARGGWDVVIPFVHRETAEVVLAELSDRYAGYIRQVPADVLLTPSADLPACRDEDPAWTAAAYPDPGAVIDAQEDT